MPDTSPSSPTINALVFSVLRSGMLASGALGVGLGTNLDDGTLTILAGVIVAFGTAVWSVVDKFSAARAARRAAVAAGQASAMATARTGNPVVVTVDETPVGVPNIATLVSASEVRGAPAVLASIAPQPAMPV